MLDVYGQALVSATMARKDTTADGQVSFLIVWLLLSRHGLRFVKRSWEIAHEFYLPKILWALLRSCWRGVATTLPNLYLGCQLGTGRDRTWNTCISPSARSNLKSASKSLCSVRFASR